MKMLEEGKFKFVAIIYKKKLDGLPWIQNGSTHVEAEIQKRILLARKSAMLNIRVRN
jgi:hypothetical protein